MNELQLALNFVGTFKVILNDFIPEVADTTHTHTHTHTHTQNKATFNACEDRCVTYDICEYIIQNRDLWIRSLCIAV